MNQKNNTTLIVTIAVCVTLIIVLLAAVILISTNAIPLRQTQSDSNEQVVQEVATQTSNENAVSDEKNSTDETINSDTPTTMYVANVENAIYLRSEPQEDSNNIITTIAVGEQVVWLENTNTVFSKISYNGTNGYVKRDYLSTQKPQISTPTSGNTAIYKYMYVANVENSIYLRSSAKETSNNIITTIPVGTEVGFIEYANNTFSKINYNGTIGYAKTIYLADYYDRNHTYLTVCNVKNSIYLRSAPVENSNNVICEIPLGAVVRYLGNPGGGFYKISYNGYTGYSKSMYLR